MKYEIAVSVFQSKCVWVQGPLRGGKHDATVFRGEEDSDDEKLRMELGREPYESAQKKIPDSKLGIADKGYKGCNKLALPSSTEPKNFKSRARCRHESFNGRLRNFNVLRHIFRHGVEKHRYAF